MRNVGWIAAALVACWSTAARAAEPEPRAKPERIPLRDNFAPWELGVVGAIVAWDVAVYAGGGAIARGVFGDANATPCAACRIGAPSDVDRRVSDELWKLGSPGRKFLGGVPDALGLTILPAIGGSYYVLDGVFALSRGRGLVGVNADHELFAFVEAYGLALGLNQTVKITVGRERPFYALGREREAPHHPRPPDHDLSFFSGHATSSFTIAAFVNRDFGDWLVARPLAASHPAVKIVVGRVLPALGCYGVATLVGVSRIVDQAHYLSDVGVGALVGTALGNAVYALHFDGLGRPRRWHVRGVHAAPVPFPGGVALAGSF